MEKFGGNLRKPKSLEPVCHGDTEDTENCKTVELIIK